MAQDWRVNALVYFCGAGSDLPSAVLLWIVGLELADMKKSLHLKTEFLPRKWPCFAIGFFSSGDEFILHLYLVCFRIRWGY